MDQLKYYAPTLTSKSYIISSYKSSERHSSDPSRKEEGKYNIKGHKKRKER